MLVFISMHSRYYELIKSNPLVAYTIANDKEYSMRVFRREWMLQDITGSKQSHLLEKLHLPNSKKHVNIVRKVHPSSIAFSDSVSRLRRIFRHDDAVKKLSHLKNINSSILLLMMQQKTIRDCASPGLLDQISASNPDNHYPLAANKLIQCVNWHYDLRPERTFHPPENMDQLSRGYSELNDEVEAINNRLQKMGREDSFADLKSVLFPAPPYPGTDSIIPVTNLQMLREEGEVQHNCVAMYDQEVMCGHQYIYRVLAPERATLAIVEAPSGGWLIEEIKGSCNEDVSKETKQAVREWLYRSEIAV